MDTSVNVKMAPQEYRLLRLAIEDAIEVAKKVGSRTVAHENFDFHLGSVARQRQKDLEALLEKF